MKSRLKTISSILVGGLFVFWFARQLDWVEVWGEVGKASWHQLGMALSLLIGTYFVRVLRWRALLAPLADCSFGSLFRATVVGYSALFILGRAGELIVRPAVLSVKDRVHPSASYATVMIERVFDMVMVVLFFAVNLVFFEYIPRDAEAMRLYGWIKGIGALLLAVAMAGVYGLSLFQRRRAGALAYLDRRTGRLPRPLGRALMSLLRHIGEGLSVLRDARGLAATLSCTALLWLMVALAHLLVVRAFGVPYEDVPFTGAVFVMGLTMLGSVVPTPGGATGPFHTAAAGALIFLGVAGAKAASVAIILHLVIFAPATLFGLYYMLKDGLSLEGLRRIGERQVEEVDGTLVAGSPGQEGDEDVAVRVTRRGDELIKEFAEEGRI
ncbi:MAG TPA: lysylphosphatidylglycerol synthase transmembrane domain-containing protein [Blastocatellia bacterium]|nr:lysylphosphatidylglycerol synthase transmembrane domain-containing protein [Blastocatellia bacterium]